MQSKEQIASLLKQAQMRISKQEEYFKVREWQLSEENNSLKEQIKYTQLLVNQIQNQNCAVCCNGDLLPHYERMISDLEQAHASYKQKEEQRMQAHRGEKTILEEECAKLSLKVKQQKEEIEAKEAYIQELKSMTHNNHWKRYCQKCR